MKRLAFSAAATFACIFTWLDGAAAQIPLTPIAPLPGATGVSRRPVIEVTVGADLHPDICKAATVWLAGSQTDPSWRHPAFSVACEGRKIRFQAQGELEAMKRYEVGITVPTGYDGSNVAPIFNWTFTTGTSTETIGRLEVVSTKPARGSVVRYGPNGDMRPTIELHFNRPIDITRCARHQAPVIAVLDRSNPKTITGDWTHTCQSMVVTATIQSRYYLSPGRRYEVVLANAAFFGAAGEAFTPPPALTFTTEGTFFDSGMSELDKAAAEKYANAPSGPGFKTVVNPKAPAMLAVTATDPPAGATEVALDKELVVTFNQDVHCRTVEPTTAAVFLGDTRVHGKVDCRAGGKVAIDPDGTLEPNTRYRLVITRGLTAAGGAFLAQPFEAAFTTSATPPPPAKNRKKGKGIAGKIRKAVQKVAQIAKSLTGIAKPAKPEKEEPQDKGEEAEPAPAEPAAKGPAGARRAVAAAAATASEASSETENVTEETAESEEADDAPPEEVKTEETVLVVEEKSEDGDAPAEASQEPSGPDPAVVKGLVADAFRALRAQVAKAAVEEANKALVPAARAVLAKALAAAKEVAAARRAAAAAAERSAKQRAAALEETSEDAKRELVDEVLASLGGAAAQLQRAVASAAARLLAGRDAAKLPEQAVAKAHEALEERASGLLRERIEADAAIGEAGSDHVEPVVTAGLAALRASTLAKLKQLLRGAALARTIAGESFRKVATQLRAALRPKLLEAVDRASGGTEDDTPPGDEE